MLRWICIVLIAVAATVALVGGALSASSRTGEMRPQPAAVSTDPLPSTQPVDQRVTIDNFTFQPQTLTVQRGAKVTWLNRDDVPHTVTSSDSPAKFKSQALDTDEAYSHVFTAPGVYSYYCAVHPHMTAQVVVK